MGEKMRKAAEKYDMRREYMGVKRANKSEEGGVEKENPPNTQVRQPKKTDAPKDSKENENLRA